jgi:hypothetical protein
MNVEIGAEAALFPEKEYIKAIFVAVCSCWRCCSEQLSKTLGCDLRTIILLFVGTVLHTYTLHHCTVLVEIKLEHNRLEVPLFVNCYNVMALMMRYPHQVQKCVD